jgi:arginase family enzyme
MLMAWRCCVDSHPDVGTPANHYPGYHAMVVAVLTGHGDPEVLRLLPATVDPRRVALVGLRARTADDFPNAARCRIRAFRPDDLRPSSQLLLDWLSASRRSRVAIHVDVDVVDSNEIVVRSLRVDWIPLSGRGTRHIPRHLANRHLTGSRPAIVAPHGGLNRPIRRDYPTPDASPWRTN